MVSIVEVTTKAQLRRFVEYPMELYKDVPQYIPGTYDDDLEDWDYWMAYDAGMSPREAATDMLEDLGYDGWGE